MCVHVCECVHLCVCACVCVCELIQAMVESVCIFSCRIKLMERNQEIQIYRFDTHVCVY